MKATPVWSKEEKMTLSMVYPSGGIKAALAALPNRRRAAILKRACILGIQCESNFSASGRGIGRNRKKIRDSPMDLWRGVSRLERRGVLRGAL